MDIEKQKETAYLSQQIENLKSIDEEIKKFTDAYSVEDGYFKDSLQVIEEMFRTINKSMPADKFKLILEFVKENNHIRDLINYIKELDAKGVNLEDLTDIIDDSS